MEISTALAISNRVRRAEGTLQPLLIWASEHLLLPRQNSTVSLAQSLDRIVNPFQLTENATCQICYATFVGLPVSHTLEGIGAVLCGKGDTH